VFANSPEICVNPSGRLWGTLLPAALTATYAASAVAGFKGAARCAAVKDLNAQCIEGDAAACQELNTSWIPRSAGPGG